MECHNKFGLRLRLRLHTNPKPPGSGGGGRLIDLLFSGQLAAAAVVAAAVYALVAIGLNLVYGTMRLLNVAHGDLVMLGGYGGYWLFSYLGISPLWSLFATGALAALAAAIAYKGLFRHVLSGRRGTAQVEANSLLMFFGFSIVTENIVALGFTATPRGYQFLSDVYSFGGISLTENRIVATLIAIAIIAVIIGFLRVSTLGLGLRALIEHKEAAAIVGVDVEYVQLISFCLGFTTAAIAGTLISMMQPVSPFMGFPFTIAAFVVIIMGGLGNIYGGVIAAIILAIIETYGVALTSSTFRSVLLYGVFVTILILRPQGLVSRSGVIR
jgi:branched-chain amino acid transport system permease protein